VALFDGTFLSIPSGEIHRMPVPSGASCHGSVDNWLFLVHNNGRCSLMNPFSKAKLQLLVQKLGLVAPSSNVDSETVCKYKSTFRAPLPDSTQEVLQLLFGVEFDPMAMNLDMVGLDEVAN
jgi:hypothetical protein